MLDSTAARFVSDEPEDLNRQLTGAKGGFSWLDPSGNNNISNLPFTRDDITLGSESELQVVVLGTRDNVDLPQIIVQSNYYKNIVKRAKTGEFPQKVVSQLESFLSEIEKNIWENSWVRLPLYALHALTIEQFESDLLEDKRIAGGNHRPDRETFIFSQQGETWLRLPVSYVLRIALIDWINRMPDMPYLLRDTGNALCDHFINDNTSPETLSFYLSKCSEQMSGGKSLAQENSLRLLTTHLLVEYANTRFCLEESGQKIIVYYAPHPPIRQRKLNDIVSDSFYRELFINPCLAGWDKGSEKYEYMMLCHQTLSRSQLNAVAKMKEAGIINSNLVVLPNTCNVSLANNGIHISIGSRKLSKLLRDKSNGFTVSHEKYLGDLVIKIVEHFLPLFVGTYSAAPYRFAFKDFHPEKALGFLPHQLDYTHLRMIWRRWQKKTANKVFGKPLTPFGPEWLDQSLARIFRLKGDFVPDVRIIDYLVSLMSTETSPSLDGTMGNHERLKKDLFSMGVFDPSMSVYFLYRLREFAKQGFTGFEGRHYSLFDSFSEDFAEAAELQSFLTACAFKLAADGEVTHSHIPDDPIVESERRQVFFQSAIGIPTFFVRKNSSNLFLRKIVSKTKNTRPSRRYKGYIRVQVREYRLALLLYLRRTFPELVEQFDLIESLRDLTDRIVSPEISASGRLTKGILDSVGAKSPMEVPAERFNECAEEYYRSKLRLKHIDESFALLLPAFKALEKVSQSNTFYRNTIESIAQNGTLESFWSSIREGFHNSTFEPQLLDKALLSAILIVYRQNQEKELK